jgi:hypothetical protein
MAKEGTTDGEGVEEGWGVGEDKSGKSSAAAAGEEDGAIV